MAVEGQNFKLASVTPPAAILDNTSAVTTEVDTLGYDYATFIWQLGATDIAITALAITESDTSGSGHANVTGLIWGTSADIAGATSTLPAATDDDTFQVAQIDLRGRKRYLDATVTFGNGTAGGYVAGFCMLSRGEECPVTVAAMGADNVLRV